MSEQTSASQTVPTPWKPQGRFVGAPMLSAVAVGVAIAVEYAVWFVPADDASVGRTVSSILLLLLIVTLVMAVCAGVGVTVGVVVGILVDRLTARRPLGPRRAALLAVSYLGTAPFVVWAVAVAGQSTAPEPMTVTPGLALGMALIAVAPALVWLRLRRGVRTTWCDETGPSNPSRGSGADDRGAPSVEATGVASSVRATPSGSASRRTGRDSGE